MAQDMLAQFLARRDEIRAEMTIRLNELDRLIKLVSETTSEPTNSGNGNQRRRRAREATFSDIIETPILNRLLSSDHLVTTKEMAALVPGKKMGPLVSAWKRRATAAGFVFENLVEKSVTAAGQNAFSLTPEGRRVLGPVGQLALKAKD